MKMYANLVVLAAAAATCNANILVNGGFESMPNWNNGIAGDGSYTLLVGNSIPGWTIADGRAATIHGSPGIYPTISGSYSLNTDGEGRNGHNVNIFQDFAADAGSSYTLSFDRINWQASTVPALSVSVVDLVTNAVLASGSYGLADGLQHETLGFVATGNPLRLTVKHDPESGFNDNTFVVDNFDVSLVPGPACDWMADGCYADYDRSGGIDGDDVIAFFSDWDSGNSCADVDASSGVDGDDVIVFFSSWDNNGSGVPGC